jgi:transcription elongation factor Elf1
MKANGSKKQFYWVIKCPDCGEPYIKGTNMTKGDTEWCLECRGKCSSCNRNVRYIFNHLWPNLDYYTSRPDAKQQCKVLSDARSENLPPVKTMPRTYEEWKYQQEQGVIE